MGVPGPQHRLLGSAPTERLLPACLEQLGGLSTPRSPMEIVGGTGADVLEGCARVVTETGADRTDALLRGAHETVRMAQQFRCHIAVLKPNSPACGPKGHYDGSFSGRFRDGMGVAAVQLHALGLFLYSPDEYLAALGSKMDWEGS